MTAVLATGEPVTLPADVVSALARRRAHAIQRGPWVERHFRPGKPLERWGSHTGCGIMVRTLTNPAESFHSRRLTTAASQPAEPVAPPDTAVDLSPQEFYSELVERTDVRRILTRLAQVEDERA